MLKWHKWQCAIFTSLNKPRIYSALIYAVSYSEFNFLKKGMWRNKILILGVTGDNLRNQKPSKRRNQLLWWARDHKLIGITHWGVRTFFFFLPPTNSYRSSVTTFEMMQPHFIRNDFLFYIFPWALGRNMFLSPNCWFDDLRIVSK